MPNCKQCNNKISNRSKSGLCRSCSNKKMWKARTAGREYYDWVGRKWTSAELYELACREYGCQIKVEGFRTRLKRWGIKAAMTGNKPKNMPRRSTQQGQTKPRSNDDAMVLDKGDERSYAERMRILNSIPGRTYYDKQLSGPESPDITTFNKATNTTWWPE